MSQGRFVAAFVVCAIALPGSASAHRLDEYLQSARISLGVSAAGVEIDLSPGVAVADQIIAAIDADRDGRFDERETEAYATAVLRALRLSVDDRPASLHLERQSFPTPKEMRQGIGTIRLRATAPIPPATGRRRLAFANMFAPAISVYQVNALVPSDGRIEVAGQRRDSLQRTFTLDYEVTGRRWWLGWFAAALAVIGGQFVARRRADVRRSARRAA